MGGSLIVWSCFAYSGMHWKPATRRWHHELQSPRNSATKYYAIGSKAEAWASLDFQAHLQLYVVLCLNCVLASSAYWYIFPEPPLCQGLNNFAPNCVRASYAHPCSYKSEWFTHSYSVIYVCSYQPVVHSYHPEHHARILIPIGMDGKNGIGRYIHISVT